MDAADLSPRSPAFRMVVAVVASAFLAACASTPAPVEFNPASINEVRFRDRAQSLHDDALRVTAAVPSADETLAMFGADLYEMEIQPIWVRVENHSERAHHLVVSGADPNHFSPLEAAYLTSGSLAKDEQERRENHFRAMHFRNPIPPNTAVSGFIYTNLDEGEKIVQVDLVAHETAKSFTFFVDVPGIAVDYRMLDLGLLHPPANIVELDEAELRTALEQLPCCTFDKTGTKPGDPLNLVIIGDFEDVAAAFARRGWLPAEQTYAKSIGKTVRSFIFSSSYRYSPVSPLFFEGRAQDMARQKPRHSINQRNHLRLWLTPMRYQGKPVFVGQVSRDIGVRFTTKTWPPVTHKIDPDIDEARQSVMEDLLGARTIATVGFVKGVGAASPTRPRANLTGDPYFTDGLRAVIRLEPGPVVPGEIQSLSWESPGVLCLGSECVD